MKSIETQYAGHTFRSRLEARWAAFFDRLTWSWSYEPVVCDGYIPDFALGRPNRSGVFLEVKGEGRIDELETYLPKCLNGLNSIDFIGQFILVGDRPLMRHTPGHKSYLGPGLIVERCGNTWEWAKAAWTMCVHCGAFGLVVPNDPWGRVIIPCYCSDAANTLTPVFECDRRHGIVKRLWTNPEYGTPVPYEWNHEPEIRPAGPSQDEVGWSYVLGNTP